MSYIIKILTLGATQVGKSSIVLRYSDNKYSNAFLSTIGVDSKSKTIVVNGDSVKVTIWDTAGQEKYKNITKQYYCGADGVLLIFDITDESSFQKLDFWYNDLKENTQQFQDLSLCLVGNKKDLNQNRIVTREVAEQYAKEKEMTYSEVSAKSGEGIAELFEDMAKKIMIKKKLNMTVDDSDKEEKERMSLLLQDKDKIKDNQSKSCCCSCCC